MTPEQRDELTSMLRRYGAAFSREGGAALRSDILDHIDTLIASEPCTDCAKQVAAAVAAEREACALACEKPKPECCGSFVSDDNSSGPVCCGRFEPGEYMNSDECAAAIRSRAPST